jgi:adenylate kinase
MKTNKTIIRELRQELHHHQMMNRVDLRAYRAGVRKCKEIAARMRELQCQENQRLLNKKNSQKKNLK